MMRLLVVCLVAASLLWPALAQAPDADTRCTDPNARDPSFVPYPEDWRVLFDTHNYERLLSSGGRLQTLNNDGGNGWTGQPSVCREQLRVCDYRQEEQPQNNWVFTQYISYLEAIEINVEVSYDYTSCATNFANGCTMLQTTMYRYETNQEDNDARRNPNNYLPNQLQVLSANRAGITSSSFTFLRSGNINGFYLGVQDTGTCGTINRITMYYRVCPGSTNGLVTIPDIPFPRADSTAPTMRSITCASDSTAVNPQVSCSANGMFAGNPECLCDPGYEFAATSCRACQPPMFKSFPSNTDMCAPCPMNTIDPFEPAASSCECQVTFSRPANEPNISCSGNPSSPRIMINQLADVFDNNVRVCWLPSLNRGGRDDFHYNIYVLLHGDTTFERRNDDPIIPETQDNTTSVCYTVRNLNPEASYTVVVVASNGATNDGSSFDDVALVQDRFIVFQIVTGEEASSLSEGAVVAITFFITALFTALITALIVIALCHYRNKGRQGSSGEFESRTVTKVNVSQTTSSKNGTTTVQKFEIENFDYEHNPPPIRPSPKPTPPARPLAPPKPPHGY